MSEQFVTDDRVLKVRAADGRFKQVDTPEGVTPGVFRNTVAAADTSYRLTGVVPDADAVLKVYQKGNRKAVARVMVTDEFREAMEYRGIRWEAGSGLTLEQQTAMHVLTDPTDRRSTKVRLKELGISQAKYTAWLKDPVFMEVYNQRTEDNLAQAVPMALNRLIANADNSNDRAIEKVLEITGRYNPSQQQMQDARTVVLTVIDAVKKHVPDLDVRKAIMSDIHEATLVFDVNNKRQLGG